MPDTNPAVQANINSLKHVMAGEKDAWLDLFAEDAVVHDPVGPSPHDPEGTGFSGREGIGKFWDSMIATGDLNIIPHKRIAVGPSIAAVIMTAANSVAGMKTSIEMIAVYEVNDAGKLQSIKVYWDVDKLNEQITAQMGAA